MAKRRPHQRAAREREAPEGAVFDRTKAALLEAFVRAPQRQALKEAQAGNPEAMEAFRKHWLDALPGNDKYLRAFDDAMEEAAALAEAVHGMDAAGYERETIEQARGDAEAAREVIDLFLAALHSGHMSDALRYYMIERLTEILAGVTADKALGLKRPAQRPKKGERELEREAQIAACDLLLERAGVKGKEERNATGPRRGSLDRATIQSLRKAHQPMRGLADDRLVEVAGAMRGKVADYFPQTSDSKPTRIRGR
jgi:hypothetical protein